MSNRIALLTDELALIEYASMTDQQRLDALHVEDIQVVGSVQSIAIAAKLEIEGRWVQMNQAEPTDGYYDTAYHVVLAINTFDAFDLTDADQTTVYNNLMNALLANSILSQGDVDDITATAYTYISRDTEIGVSNSTLWEVEQARTN